MEPHRRVGKSWVEGEEVGMGPNPAQCLLCSGLQALGQTFGANPAFASSLRYLDLSKNPGLLATDEANVSPENIAQAPQKHAQSSGPGSLRPVALPFPGSPSVLVPRPSTVSWPSPMP